MLLVYSIVFISAFLLFQIELVVGKIFLPNFGGSYFVWGACVVFFQAILLLGYMFSHFVTRWIGIQKYRILHVLILLLPFLFFPGKDISLKHPQSDLPMVFDVFGMLFITIGPAFFVLSTISVVSQFWVANSDFPQKKNPYVLFGVSNLGSFLALLSYPFIFENYFDLIQQMSIWRVTYCILVVLQILAFVLFKVKEVEIEKPKPINIGKRVILEWYLYSAAAVVLFLSVTNIVTLEIAPMPFLWILPLAIYLLSFVLNFKERPFYPKFIDKYAHYTIGFGVLYYFAVSSKALPVIVTGIAALVFLFFMCMICQSRLYASRPQAKNELTFFYMVLSFGGFLGGMFATWIIPVFANNHLEFIMGIFMLCVAINISEKEKAVPFDNLIWSFLLALLLFMGRFFVLQFKNLGLIFLLVIVLAVFHHLRKRAFGLTIALFVIVMLANRIEVNWIKGNCVYSLRNYYGIIKVLDVGKVRFLLNGKTVHGAQVVDSKNRAVPIAYYNPSSPVVELILSVRTLKRIGIVGLGTGSLAAYASEDQLVDFYELDRNVVSVAEKYFLFLDRSLGIVRHFVGDARRSLERKNNQGYQLMVVDAFNGDAIPTHLLTKEGIEVFKRHLSKEGILVFHVTNQYIKVIEPLVKTAYGLGANVLYKDDIDSSTKHFYSEWVALTWNDQAANQLSSGFNWEVLQESEYKRVRSWTDKYTNILPHILYKKILNGVKHINR